MAMTGTVKFFNAERGYGFIKPDDGGRDVFVHITAVERAGLKDLTEGQRITFEVEPDKKGKGPKAVNLVISLRRFVGASPSRDAHRPKKSRPQRGREVGTRGFLVALRSDSSRRRAPSRTGSRSTRR